MTVREKALAEALEDMVYQFAYWAPGVGGFTTGGLSALEGAFELLGWTDPHVAPEVQCDEPGCLQRATCGSPTENGYRRTCGEHCPKETP